MKTTSFTGPVAPLHTEDCLTTPSLAAPPRILLQPQTEPSSTRSTVLQDLPELADMAGFELLLRRELNANRRAGTRLALVLIDFEAVLAAPADVDTGHLDHLRRLLGRRARARARSTDAVMRIGTQRFAVLLRNVGRADVQPIQTRLYDGLSAAYQLGGPLQSVQLFIGLAKHVDVSSTAAELIAAAELALGRDLAQAGWQNVDGHRAGDLQGSRRLLS